MNSGRPRRAGALVFVAAAVAATLLALPGADVARDRAPHRSHRAALRRIRFGFNTYVSPRTIAQEHAVGAAVSRMVVAWSAVEPAPGQWDWQRYDQQYRALVSARLEPEIVAVAAPCWARPSMACNDAQYTGPPNPSYDSEWMQFVGRLAARYPRAIGIEIWNEPNLNMFFWPKPDAARYVQLLREAYGAIKARRPSMPVISGGIAQSPAPGRVALGEGDGPFLAGMYAAGARGSMDAIGAHPYPIELTPGGGQRWALPAMEQSLDRLRAVRAAAGAATTPIWVTEVGESTSTQPGFPPPVTLAVQAGAFQSIALEAMSDGDVPVLIIHTLEDQAAGALEPWAGVDAGFGVFTASGVPKPSACVLSAIFHGSLVC